MAERAGITQPALSRIELGGAVPDLETLRRLGNAMGVGSTSSWAMPWELWRTSFIQAATEARYVPGGDAAPVPGADGGIGGLLSAASAG